MAAYTISTHFGTAVRREHNIRDYGTIWRERDSHVTVDRFGEGSACEVWHDEPETVAYDRIFGEAVRKYNERQTRPERRISNYHEDIKRDSHRNAAYEEIVTVGNRDNAPAPELQKAILRQYADEWSTRNPNMELIGAYYHADEQGTPHVHIDFIPVAHGYRRGPETQTSISRACREMGFVPIRPETAETAWQRSENAALEAICRKYGLSIEHPQRGKGVEHAQTEAYKVTASAKSEAERIKAEAREAARQATIEAGRPDTAWEMGYIRRHYPEEAAEAHEAYMKSLNVGVDEHLAQARWDKAHREPSHEEVQCRHRGYGR